MTSYDVFKISGSSKSEIYQHIEGFQLLNKNQPFSKSFTPKEVINSIRKNLRAKYQASTSWGLVFSDKIHGRCYKEMIHNLGAKHNPFVLIIEDTDGGIFGSYFENNLQHKVHSFGKSSTALFKYNESKFDWYKSSPDCFSNCLSGTEFVAFGCSNSKFGLLIKNDLINGETNSVKTFNNSILAKSNLFKIKNIEIWAILD